MPQVGSCIASLCTCLLATCATAESFKSRDASLHQPAEPKFAAKHLKLGRVGSFLARQAGQAHSTRQPVKHSRARHIFAS